MNKPFRLAVTWGCACVLVCGARTMCAQDTSPEPPKGGSVSSPKAPSKPQKGASEGIAGTDAAQTPADKPAGAGDAAPGRGRGTAGGGKGEGKPEKTAYDYSLPGSDGKDLPVSKFKGKVVVLVNLARNSSYNAQLPALEKLSETYKDKGLVVIGVPSNEFGAAEPGTDAEIQKSYTEAKVTFPVTLSSSLTGVQELPLFTYMTKGKTVPEGGAVHWNYTKFVIDKNGKVVARFEPDVAPDSPEMLATIDQVLSGKFKPHKDEPKEGGGGDEGGDGPE
jgi:glutathione peroxidase